MTNEEKKLFEEQSAELAKIYNIPLQDAIVLRQRMLDCDLGFYHVKYWALKGTITLARLTHYLDAKA